MNAERHGTLLIVWSIACFLGWIPLPAIVSLVITLALLLAYWRAVDRAIDAKLTQQYTGRTHPEAKP